MNIGLLDIDGHNFPNLALMKISSYHKAIGDNVEFADSLFGEYDIIYKSKVFTWTEDPKYSFKTKTMYLGGTGYSKLQHVFLQDEVEHSCPDYSLYKCQHAYGFLTRGCIRNCEWCIVPEKEGYIKPHADIDEFISDKKSAILMDNNVLAHTHGVKQIEKIIKKGIKIDFNQGLDARLIDDSTAKLLSRVKWLSAIRLACDSPQMMKHIQKAVTLLRWNNCVPSRYFVYILVKDVDESIERIKFLKGLSLDIFAQAYRDKENNPISQKQNSLCAWVNTKAMFKRIPWKRYWKNRYK
jgi:hypothetical protein